MVRMDHSTFCTILRYIEKDITPNELASEINVIRAPERLVLTIRYFETGETFRSLSFQFRVVRNAISSIIVQMSKALIFNMPHYIALPQDSNAWFKIAADFENQWNFPNGLGVVDGKHVVIKPPPDAGSNYYN